MNDAALFCADERRRKTARDLGWNGIDDVEVGDNPPSLCVSFFGHVPDNLAPANVRIEGGRRIRNLKIKRVEARRSEDPEQDDCLSITLDRLGDFSPYTLRLVEAENGKPTDRPLAGFDPRYAHIQFSFRIDCAADLDCADAPACPPAERPAPEINYLAKDYASFRQLMLDRLALIMPDWRERHAPDLGIALVEVLAYVGDHLSYYQDSVATEAYLDTARRRISVRRHARLVDYQMHEGCNARAWLCAETDEDRELVAENLAFLTSCPALAELGGPVFDEDQIRAIPPDYYEVFEPIVADRSVPIRLRVAHNRIALYTWGDAECCLARGATQATLLDTWVERAPEPPPAARAGKQRVASAKAQMPAEPEAQPERGRALDLRPGDVVIFEEVLGPRTGDPADANPAHRHAVRLTAVTPGVDPLDDTPVLEITWDATDALPFTLCISARLPATHEAFPCEPLNGISLVRGNVLLVDHGRTLGAREQLGAVAVREVVGECGCDGSAIERRALPAPFHATLSTAPLTYSQPLAAQTPAMLSIEQDPHAALPQLDMVGLPAAAEPPADPADPIWRWQSRFDLLGSGPRDQHFVVEIDNDRRAHVRFGDGDTGRMPAAGFLFSAGYRVGNGTAGNVGAETIRYVLVRKQSLSGAVISVRNPMPARGGTAVESIDEVKLLAPHAYRRDLQRAITADDYGRLAERPGTLQRAAASLRWTGSWYEAQVAVDPRATDETTATLLGDIGGYLHRYRRAGHDLQIAPAEYVPIDVELDVCVQAHVLRGHVKGAVLERLGSRVLRNGQRGFFHPDNLTFGGGVYLSALVAAAQAIPGVQSVTVKKLERLFQGPNGEIDKGVLALGPLEIARCDNDPNFPENGRIKLSMRGGR